MKMMALRVSIKAAQVHGLFYEFEQEKITAGRNVAKEDNPVPKTI